MGKVVSEGLLIALVPFFLTIVWSRYWEWVRRKRERKGLIKLLHIEIANNKLVLDRMKVSSQAAQREVSALSIKAWEDSRARLANLLANPLHFEYLVSYYGAIQMLKDSLLHSDAEDLDFAEVTNQLANIETRPQVLAEEVCRVETGLTRGWSKGLLVSFINREPSRLTGNLEGPTETDQNESIESR